MNPPASEVFGARNGDSLAYLVTNVRSYPAMFVFQGRTPFIHSHLCYGGLPRTMQNSFAICAVYLTMTHTNKLAEFQSMEARLAELIHESNEASWSFLITFAGVQALIPIPAIHLFD